MNQPGISRQGSQDIDVAPVPVRPFLADRLKAIQPSPSVAANARVAELRRNGADLINFTIGEPDMDTPAHILDTAINAARAGDTHYTPTQGTDALRRAIQEKLARDNGLSYEISEIVVGCGAKHVLYHAFAATINSGDEVIIPAPYWVSYPDLALLHGGVPVIVNGDAANGLKLTPEALRAAITPRSKWFVLNSPNNPSGAVYSRSELQALADVLRDHPNLWILADEIYEHFVFDGAEHLSIAAAAPDLKARTLVLNGVSKSYAMTGWRIGFGAGPSELIKPICMLLSQTTTCPSSVSQAAAAVAFSGDQAPLAEIVASFTERRRLVLNGLAAASGLQCIAPEGAFYVLVDASGLIGRTTPTGSRIASEEAFVAYLLDRGVAVIGGGAYGISPYFRLSFATSTDLIEEGCRRIVAACSDLK